MMTTISNIQGQAFIGVSLDSKLFTRDWIRYALNVILERHNALLFLIADDLLRYTRTTQTISGKAVLGISATSHLINQRRLEFEIFLNSEIKNLDCKTQERVLIKNWCSFADNRYVHLFRNLHIAYITIGPFQDCVNNVAMAHIKKASANCDFPNSLQTSAAFLLDEVAMCIRITEMDNFPFEYYPSEQINILSELYADKFSSYGLTIESLTEKDKRARSFQILNNDKAAKR